MRLQTPARSLTRSLAVGATLVALSALSGCGGDSDGTATDSPAGSDTSAGAETSPSTGSSDSTDSTDSSGSSGSATSCSYTAGGEAAKKADLPPESAAVTGEAKAEIETSIGTLNATLDGSSAPCTVNSFVSLAEQGYFDGTTCHRLTTGAGLLVLQCGDPSATGRGGPGYAFDDELSGEETYGAGTLAMANAGPNTNGSQFFIVYGDSELPPSYTVFGSVDADSVALVQKVADAGTDNANGQGDGAPVTPVDISKVTVDN